MAEGVVSFGVQKLWELLSRESERLSGIGEQVDRLKRKLRRLQSLLKDAYAKKHESERVKSFLEDVEDIVYDAEDLIESFLLKGKEKGIKKRVQRLACFLVDHRSFATDIEGITKRISEVIEEMQSFGIRELIDRGRSLSLQERQSVQRESRQTFFNSSESDLVGVEQSVEELVGRLVEKDNNFQVVSITGMGGIGKTTLARQVFHHDIVRRHFDGFAWVCVSQEFTQKHIWQRMLQDFRPHDCEDILKMDEYTLQGQLFQLLGTSRYLIVLDDIWKNEDWDRIKAVFPSQKGLKMLLTSRNEGVGLYADPTCFAFRPKILTPEEEFRINEELEAIGQKMVTYCGGLPLAVRVLGGMLAPKHTVREWEKVSNDIGPKIVRGTTYGIVDPSSVYRILSLSYEDLPMHLKHCFLYLAHYPEDYNINMGELFFRWAAEGIIVSTYDGSTIQETGEAYMEEVVRRNMVSAGRNKTFGDQSCQMHDMMREVRLSKAKEEKFVQVVKILTSTSTINSQSPSRPRRLVVHSDIAFQMLGCESNPKVRSLFCFALGNKGFRIKSAQWFRSLPFLRVLDLSYVEFEGNKLPYSIGELVHLRFLSLYKARVTHLPTSLGNLKLLLHLNLDVSFWVIHVPNVLKEMLELRCLILPPLMHDKTNLELGDLVNLEYLWGFSTKHNSATDLLCMTRLTNLNVIGEFSIKTLLSLSELRHLEKLTLHQCNMEEDPMPILENLLHSVILLKTCAFAGKRMVCSKGGFSQLCDLEIRGQEMLEEWIVEEGSMPCLHTLTICNCKKLKELPCGIKYITSLKELKIRAMKKEWAEKLVPGGEDYYKVQHIPSVQFIHCDE